MLGTVKIYIHVKLCSKGQRLRENRRPASSLYFILTTSLLDTLSSFLLYTSVNSGLLKAKQSSKSLSLNFQVHNIVSTHKLLNHRSKAKWPKENTELWKSIEPIDVRSLLTKIFLSNYCPQASLLEQLDLTSPSILLQKMTPWSSSVGQASNRPMLRYTRSNVCGIAGNLL